MNKINIAFGLDQKYILPAFVVIHSILHNSVATFNFFILTTDDIEADLLELQNSLREKYKNFDIHIVKIRGDYFKTAKINCPHLSNACFNRLLIAEFIKDADKCIYLDCDLIVNYDLALLYEYDLENNYIAGVKDCHLIGKSKYEEEHRIYLGVDSCEKYINSGVLVMNLKKLREEHMTEQFVKQSQKNNLYEDQDVLNYCCYGHIGILPLKWNLFHFYLGDNIKFIKSVPFDKQEFEFDYNKPYILHMGAEYKPWNSKRFKGAEQWWKYAEIYKKNRWYDFYENKSESIIHTDLDYFLNRLNNFQGSKIIWGYTKNAMQLYDILNHENIEDIICFVDNDNANAGKIYKGLKVIYAKEIFLKLDNFKKVAWIISCQTDIAFLEVKKQILDLGVPENYIFRSDYNIKPIYYYLALEESYYNEEIDEIVRCELLDVFPICEYRKNYIEKKIEVYKSQRFQEIKKKYKMNYWCLKNCE